MNEAVKPVRRGGQWNWILGCLPLLVCVALMLPRLRSAQFGLFDDGRSVVTARQITQGVWDMSIDDQEGRSRPMYWLSFTLIYWIFGSRPVWFFLGNTLVLVGTTAGLMGLVRCGGGSKTQAWVSGLLFALSGPVIESYYTLSKPEAGQLAWMVVSLLCIAAFGRMRQKWQKLGVVTASATAVMLASLTKETGLLLLPISLAWLAVGWLRGRHSGDGWGLANRGAYAAAALAGSLGFLAYRLVFVSPNLFGGTYASGYALDLGQIAASALRWMIWLGRDFVFIVPLLIVTFFGALAKPGRIRNPLALDALVWMTAWICVYLPWTFAVEYYLLPFAAGFAVWAGWLIIEAAGLLAAAGNRRRITLAAGLGLSGVLFLGTLATNVSTARIQLAVDAANDRVLRQLAESAPPFSTVLVNIQQTNEWVYETRIYLNAILDRPDISVDAFKFQGINPGEGDNPEKIYVIAPEIANQPLLTVRLGVVEATQNQWNKTLEDYLTSDWQVSAVPAEQFRLVMVDLPRLLCPLIRRGEYCTATAPVIDLRPFSFGWKLYALEKP